MLSLAALGGWARRKETILLLLIILVGAILRFYELGAESIWLDEATGIRLSIEGVTTIVKESGTAATHPPFYFIILHYWMSLFGTSEVAVRSLSAIFGIISILLIYRVGSILFNRKVGLIGGFLLAVSPFQIWYSQEARPYSLLLLLSLLSYLLFIKILREDRKWYYGCYFITSILLGYTHFYGLFIIASQALFFLLFWGKYRLQRVKLSATVAATIAGLVPLVFLLGQAAAAIAEKGFWIPEPQLMTILETLAWFAGSKWLLLVFAALALFGLFSIRRIAGRWGWTKPLKSLKSLTLSIKLESIEEELLLIFWLFVSIIIPYIESKFMTPIFLFRYMIGATPALYLLAARGMGNLSKKWILSISLIVIVILSSLVLQPYYKYDQKNYWRQTAEFIAANARVESDVLVFSTSRTGASYIQNSLYTGVQVPFNYYYTGELQELVISTSVDDTEKLAAFVDEASRGKERLWLILSYGGQDVPIRYYLESRYGSESILIDKEFKGIRVMLFDLSVP